MAVKAHLNEDRSGTGISKEKELVTFGGGCFWCLEAVFDELRGVVNVESGYSGGRVENPSYEEVCTGTTGHAEVVQITFDQSVISYEEILQVFFNVHDPTTMNRQDPDVGSQYRSVIFYRDEEQKSVAEKVMREIAAEGTWKAPIVTQLVPFKKFYMAEDYHQEYFRNNPAQPYCQMIILPKVDKFMRHYHEKLKPQ